MINLNSKYSKSCLSIKEVALEIGVTEDAVKALIDDGQLPSLNVGNEILITVPALEKFLGICQQDLDNVSVSSYHTTNSADGWEIMIEEGDATMSKGSVTYVKASNRWIVQFDMGKTPDGKRIRKSKSFKTEDEALNALALETARLYPNGVPEEVKIPTYEELAVEFLNAKNSTATGRTWDTYRDFSKYSRNILGEKRVNEIEKSDVIKMFDKLKTEYADSTLKKVKTVAGMIFDLAIEKEYIKKNPVKALKKLPKSEVSLAKDDDYKALTDDELEHVLSLAKENKSVNGMVFLLAYTGMRPGELRGLRVSDINLEKEELHIRRAASSEDAYDDSGKRKGKREYIKETKNGDYGNRTLRVPRFVLEMALAQRDDILADKKYQKAKNSIYLFPSTTGDFIRESAFNKRWRTFREKNGLDYNTYFPYVFRHTMCTKLAVAGKPVATIQRIIGDNTVEVIMKIYTHINLTDVTTAMSDIHNSYDNLFVE